MKIGIDFSINSTAITVLHDDGHREYFSFVPNYQPKKAAFKYHSEFSDLISVISYEKLECVKNNIQDQQIKIQNAANLSKAIIDTLDVEFCNCNRINIEGFSFASKGNSFVDMIQYNTFLKARLLLDYNQLLFSIPPKSLKKLFTGNGDASKGNMIQFYIDNYPSELSERINELRLDLGNKSAKIPKPFDDLIDSIALTYIADI